MVEDGAKIGRGKENRIGGENGKKKKGEEKYKNNMHSA